MIEENFGELDSDFLKVWAQYLLDGDWGAHAKNVEKLAELGQINAIAEYFRADPEDVNPIIAKNLNSNESENFNVLYAKALQKEKEETKNGEFSVLLKKFKQACHELDNEDFLLKMNFRGLSDFMKEHELLTNQKKVLEGQIKSYKFVELLNRAASSCFKAWKDTQNPVFLENFCEMGLKHRDVMFGQNRSAVDFLGTARKFNKIKIKTNSYYFE